MTSGWRILSAVALVLAAASIALSAFLFTRLSDQQSVAGRQQAALKANDKAICAVQGISFAGILANLGLDLQRANIFAKDARDPTLRAYYAQEAPALRSTLDGLFKKPPRCGEAFTFEIQIQGEKTRRVKTGGSTR